MAGNLSTIGFAVHDMDAFARLAATAVEEGERLDARHARWAVGGGAELWVTLDGRGRRICSMQPHFAGEAAIPVVVTEVLREATVRLEPEAGAPALAVDLVAPALLGGVALPARGRLQAAVFAHEVAEVAPAAPSTIPTGLSARRPVAELLCHAAVREAEWRANAVTGRRFARLALAGGLEVVADPGLLGELPAPGAVVRAAGWITGRLHDAAELPAPRRRLGRRRRLG